MADTEFGMADHPLLPAFEDVLNSPYEEDYGSEESEITYRNLSIRVGDRPFCRNLRKLYKLSHRELPPDLAVFDKYDIWLVCHAIGALRKQNDAVVVGLGYEADFSASPQLLTVDLLPQTKFNTVLDGALSNSLELRAEGNAQIPQAAQSLLEQCEFLGLDAKLQLSGEAKCVGRITFKVMTPLIQAVGKGSARCQWLFEQDAEPLLGDQVMLQTVLVPRNTSDISFKCRGYALIRPKWLPFGTPFQTGWIDVKCML